VRTTENMSNTTTTRQWKMENVQFNAPKEQRNPLFSKKIFINDTSKPRGNTDLKITLPSLYTFGIQPFKDDKNKFSFSLQFPMKEHGKATKETDEALDKLMEFENSLIDHMTFKSASYFAASHTREKIKSMYRPLLKYPKKKDSSETDYDTPPYVPVRLQYYAKDKLFKQFNIFDEKGLPTFTSPCKSSPVELVSQGQFVKCELFFSNVWMSKNSFGVELFATNLQVYSSQNLEEEEEAIVYDEYELVKIDGVNYWHQSKEHGSSIYEDGDTEDSMGKVVGCWFHGQAKLFR
jgi:hypothetical protein